MQKQPVQPVKTWNKQFMRVYYWALLGVVLVTMAIGLVTNRKAEDCPTNAELMSGHAVPLYCGPNEKVPWQSVVRDSVADTILMIVLISVLLVIIGAILEIFKKVNKLSVIPFILIPMALIVLWVIYVMTQGYR